MLRQKTKRYPEEEKRVAYTMETKGQNQDSSTNHTFQTSDKSFENAGMSQKSSKQNFLATNKVGNI